MGYGKRMLARVKGYRTVSPVIATVLLIALSVIAGLLLTITVLTILTIPQPIQVTVETPFDYKSSDSDVLIDSFRFGLRNDGDFAVQILNPKANIKILRGNAELKSWKVTFNESTFVVNARSSVILTMKMETVNLQEQLKKNDKFQITLQDALLPLGDNTENIAPSTVTSRTFTVGDTYGPLKFFNSSDNGTHLEVNVTNLGTVTLTIQARVSSDTVSFVDGTVSDPIIMDGGDSTILTWEHAVPSAGSHIILLEITDLERGTLLKQKIIVITA